MLFKTLLCLWAYCNYRSRFQNWCYLFAGKVKQDVYCLLAHERTIIMLFLAEFVNELLCNFRTLWHYLYRGKRYSPAPLLPYQLQKFFCVALTSSYCKDFVF